jgi:hypothetical protein
MALGVLGVGVVAVYQLSTWFQEVPAPDRIYFPCRVLYALAQLTAVPLVQVTAAGLFCWLIGRRRQRMAVEAEARAGELPPGLYVADENPASS